MRLPFVVLALCCLLLGLWTGLIRIGWNLAVLPVSMHHGAIMVGGFLGTLIALEKIIPLKRRFLYAIPLVSALSMIAFLAALPTTAFGLLILASSGLTAVFIFYLTKERNVIYGLMAAGSVCWLTGNLLLAVQHFYPLAFPWWLGFALLIITAERLELSKFLPVSKKAKRFLIMFVLAYVLGVAISFHGPGRAVSGAALVAISIWLMRYDLIAISIRKEGLPRFIAIALLAGYTSMLLTGIFFLGFDDKAFGYDAIVHTFFLGFVFSMIFAHGPIILPGVLGLSVKPYHRILYVWLALLHISWIIRIGADVLLLLELRKISGMITAIAIPGYFVTVATMTFIQRRHAKVL